MRTEYEQSDLLVDLFRAYFDARRHKANTANALTFAAGYEEKLIALYEDIVARRYEISRSVCFIVDTPVKREIFAADFRDRVVHHLLFNYINPIFEPHFIKDSYSCRRGKGTSYGIDRLAHFMRSCSENYSKPGWVLKLDIQGYFMNMDKHILWEKIQERVRGSRTGTFDRDTILYLLRKVIFHDPTTYCVVRELRQDWVGLPKSKSLFFAREGAGLPLGNLTSQLFGNIYLDAFDHYVKEVLEVQHYGRYVDDMVFVHEDKARLLAVVQAVRVYVATQTKLRIHPKKMHLQPIKHGVSFLGVYVKPWRIYAGTRVKGAFRAKVRGWNEQLVTTPSFPSEDEATAILPVLNSYLGLLGRYDTFRLRSAVVGGMRPALRKRVAVSADRRKATIVTGDK